MKSLYPAGMRSSQELYRYNPPLLLPLSTLVPSQELHTTGVRERLGSQVRVS